MNEIEKAILSALYKAWDSCDGALNLDLVRQQGGWERNTFEKVEYRLRQGDLIRARGVITHEITAIGVIRAEQVGIVDGDSKKRNDEIRTRLMEALFDLYEREGPLAY